MARTDDFWGAVKKPEDIHPALERLFPGSPVGSLFPGASRLKSEPSHNNDPAVKRVMSEPVHLEDVDPRTLATSQSGVTRPGVQHYLGQQFSGATELYADQHQAGNAYPMIRERQRPYGVTREIMSGNHRAAAALLTGRPLRARVVRD